MARYDMGMNNAFTNIDESHEHNLYEENQANSLKLQSLVEDEFYTGSKEEAFRNYYLKKKKEKRKRKRAGEEVRKISNRKIVNLPATQPYIKMMDGEERLCFKYNTKVSESALSAMPKAELEENEFSVRFDLESVDISKLNEKFKADNCVYPRANIPYELYMGNRWNYETECNRLAWQFVSLNPVLLYGKKGLIQRAVDSYRNISKSRQGHKFYKDDTFFGDIEKRKHALPALSSVHIQWTVRGVVKKCKVQTGVEHVDYAAISDDFKVKYSVLNDTFDENSFGLECWESRNVDNELAVKIAYLNVENTSFLNAIKAIGVYSTMKKAVEAYKNKKEELCNSSEDDTEAFDVVNETLDKAFNDTNRNLDINYYFSTVNN
ncbi:hypothetical protein PAPHI01_1439 [Pancytospora philotis]|nr:hypothetical protein PAPHI01_1439 [Pancytospora philotis]